MESQDWKSEANVRAYLLRLIERGYAIFAVFGALASTSRAWYTGWQSIYSVHLTLAVMVLALHVCPLRLIGHTPRIYFAVLIPGAVGLSGIYAFGFYGNGLAWTIVACAMAAVFLPLLALVTYVSLLWLATVAIGMAYIHKLLQLPVNGGEYIHQVLGWTPIFIGSLVLNAIVMTVVFGYKRAIGSLLQALVSQRDIIHHRASHDQLTGLSNKGVADDRLSMACERVKREGGKAALLFLDLGRIQAHQ